MVCSKISVQLGNFFRVCRVLSFAMFLMTAVKTMETH